AEEFLQIARASPLREAENAQGLVHFYNTDQVGHQPDLLRRSFQVLQRSRRFHLAPPQAFGAAAPGAAAGAGVPGAAAPGAFAPGAPGVGIAAFSTFLPLWPLKVRVMANSPSL